MKNTTTTKMPTCVKASDLKRAAWGSDDILTYSESVRRQIPTEFEMHLVESDRRGGTNQWMIATLHISNASSRQRMRGVSTDSRSYAIGVSDKKIYTVGLGPHVKQSVTVYVKPSNISRLQPLLDLYQTGMNDANMIRDRRSSRAAQTKAYRASLYNSFLS